MTEIGRWAQGSGLEALLIVLGSVLVVRGVRWAADRLVVRAGTDTPVAAGEIASSEERKHKGALAQVVAWTSAFLVYFTAALLVLERLNVPVTSLVAPATVAGVAIGFGAQRLVQDLLSGFFIFAERQYGYGDVIRIAPPGDVAGVSGTVEEVTLRTTKLRTVNGELIVVPNGEIRQVTNLSKDWARVVLDIPLPIDADVTIATEVLRGIGEDVASDERWSPSLLDAPSVMGIERINVGFLQLRFVARTLPGRQWAVGRELRGRIAVGLREAGIAAQPTVLTAAGQASG